MRRGMGWGRRRRRRRQAGPLLAPRDGQFEANRAAERERSGRAGRRVRCVWKAFVRFAGDGCIDERVWTSCMFQANAGPAIDSLFVLIVEVDQGLFVLVAFRAAPYLVDLAFIVSLNADNPDPAQKYDHPHRDKGEVPRSDERELVVVDKAVHDG